MRDLCILGGTVVTMDATRRVLQGDLMVEGGAIAAIADPHVTARGPNLDATGCLVIPGLIQSHVHMCQTLMRGHADDLDLLSWLKARIWPYEGALDEAAAAASARLACAELMLGGTTAVLDMATVHHTDVIFDAARESGLRATIGKAMMDAGAGVPASLREDTRASIDESLALIQRWHGTAGGRLRYAWAPRFVLSCTEGLLRETCAEARRTGTRIHTHASEQRAEIDVVRRERGMDNVAYLDHVGMTGADVGLAHCVWLSETEKSLLGRTGTHVLHCPSSNLKLGSGIAEIPDLLSRGVNVSIGADGAPCNNNLDAWMEMRLAALLPKHRDGVSALPAEDAFELATLGGARALGLEDKIGSLEVGKRADIVVVEVNRAHVVPAESPYSQLVYACRASDVRHVVIDGQIVVRDGKLETLELPRVLSEARRHARRVAGAL
jgi:5-methylthioadenosine/S-adenosylhomocysteine deaminase